MTFAEVLTRLGIAAALGIILGAERHLRGHPAGISTHSLVATGAAVFTLAGAYGYQDLPLGDGRDPARVAAQVASGIGFVGAGAILKDGSNIRGLTTAASVWASGSLGVAAATGSYSIAILGLGAVMAALTVARVTKIVESRVGHGIEHLTIYYATGFGTLGPIVGAVTALEGTVIALTVDDSAGDQRHERRLDIDIRIPSFQRSHLDELVRDIANRPEVRRISTALSEG